MHRDSCCKGYLVPLMLIGLVAVSLPLPVRGQSNPSPQNNAAATQSTPQPPNNISQVQQKESSQKPDQGPPASGKDEEEEKKLPPEKRWPPKGTNAFVAILGSTIAMLGGLWLVFARLKEKQEGFDADALKALGLVLFLSTLLIVGVVVPGFSAETLAALLGTVGGYVLSHVKSEGK